MRQRQQIKTRTAGQKRAGAILFVFSLLFAIAAVTLPHNRLLLSRARRIAPATQSWVGKFRVSYPCYWLSDQKAMRLQHPAIRRLVLPPGLQTNAATLDTVTGIYRPMPEITRAVTTQFPDLIADVGFAHDKTIFIDVPCRVSPDGQWAVFTEETGNPCWNTPPFKSRNTLVNMNDFQAHHGAWRSGEGSILWKPDSRQWVEWDNLDENRVRITCHMLEGKMRRQTVNLPAELSDYYVSPCAITPENTILAEAEPPTPISDTEETPASDCKCEMVRVPIGSAAPISHFTLSLPMVKNVVGQRITFSPNCDRVAWLVTTRYEPTGLWLWRRLRARFGDTAHEETTVWISKADGTEAREIGHIAHKPDESRPQQLAWLPSGTQLSFNYKGDLYTVPAD